ncbi:uncharacterized protein LOC111677793 [Lucilia cuprina]|uniref:uncharacterized protein LOC111677793 n=1 Tax=Lucilia cuprina TaxID=7375 RepID=UPI001F05E6D0|nr:uncharacterized protein LOC111677793 [Lucilia cuprina]
MNRTEEYCIAIALAQAIKQKQQKKRKRLWMKECFRKRNQFTHETLLNELKMGTTGDFAIDEDSFEEILTLVGPKIQKQDTQMREAISPAQRLTITLYYLATGKSFADLKSISYISERAIGRIVLETCNEINNTLANYIKLPSNKDEWKKHAANIYHNSNFPNCLGVINGKHIPIRKPTKSTALNYYNYRKFFSLVLMAIVDANYEFIMVDVDTNGAVCDGYGNTTFVRTLTENGLNLPKSGILPSSEQELPYVFVGDSGFQLTNNILTSYSQLYLSEEESIYNYRFSCAQRIAENAFNILLSRFKVLQRTIGLAPEKVQIIILTCCYLHNFWLRKMKQNGICVESVNYHLSTPLQRTHCRNATSSAQLVREQFCSYFNNEGKVLWQIAN